MNHKHKKKYRIEPVIPADIVWQDKTAVSSQFEDIYFSEHDGIKETQYVFLKQNHLPEAWLGKNDFTVLETGFGTGLNFFCTLDLWFQTNNEKSCLHYISVEKHPVTLSFLKSLIKVWPDYAGYIEELVKNYPPLVSGFHSCELFNGRVKLLLLFGDAAEQFARLQAKADVCFLDGFAPSKNQSMWSELLFKQIARLMKPGGTISTFTAVGDVRRGLMHVGFDMKKADAYGNKRHMLTGVFQSTEETHLLKPWFQYDAIECKERTVTVIGAGIAGITTAVALYKAGWKVTVLEKASAVAAGASGNLAGVVMPRMDKEQNSDAIFYWQAYFSALKYYESLQSEGIDFGWEQSGVMQLTMSEQDSQSDWPETFFSNLSKQVAQNQAGLDVNAMASFLPAAAHLNPEKLCQNLFQKFSKCINFVFDADVVQLNKTEAGWQLKTSQKEYQSQAVIICNAEFASQFEQTEYLPIQPVRGQITYVDDAIKSKLKTVICDKGYVIPASSYLVLGATFERDSTDRDLSDNDQLKNIQQFNDLFDIDFQVPLCEKQPLAGRASIRAMTEDRMPLVGAVPDHQYYAQHYADLSRGRKPESYQKATYHQGLFINTGHGSRGLTSSIWSAEIITALISDTPVPVESELLVRLHPARFIIKKCLKRG